MSKVIEIDALASEIQGVLDNYNSQIIKGVKKETKRAMKDLVTNTKAVAPVGKRKQHYKDSKKIKNQERLLYKAINQYGIENFSIEQIEECPSSKSNEREKFWIEYYDSFKNGYNATLGGDGSANLDYDLIYNIYQQKKSLTETAKIIGCCEDSVRLVLKKNNISQKNILLNKKRTTSI